MAHHKKLSSKDVMARRGNTRSFGKRNNPESFRAVVRCYRCSERRVAAESMSRMPQGHRRDGQLARRIF